MDREKLRDLRVGDHVAFSAPGMVETRGKVKKKSGTQIKIEDPEGTTHWINYNLILKTWREH